jgi:hypothetical protein
MFALRRPVAASAPLVAASCNFRDGRGKIKKQRPGKLFLIFFVFKDISATSLRALCRISRRPADFSDVEIAGESIDHVVSPHEWSFPFNEDNTLPLAISLTSTFALTFSSPLTIVFWTGLSASRALEKGI